MSEPREKKSGADGAAVKPPKTRKQKMLIAVVSIAAAAAVLTAVVFGILPLFDREESVSPPFLYPADYEENIFEDPSYMKRERGIFYIENGTGQLVADVSGVEFPKAVYFFEDYFDAVINGDAQRHAEMFSAAYAGTLPERFTMQKVYDINITFVDRQGDPDDGVTYEFYEVRYKILYNNGTYRDDIGAGEVRPLMYTLVINGDDIKINAIEPIKYEYD